MVGRTLRAATIRGPRTRRAATTSQRPRPGRTSWWMPHTSGMTTVGLPQARREGTRQIPRLLGASFYGRLAERLGSLPDDYAPVGGHSWYETGRASRWITGGLWQLSRVAHGLLGAQGAPGASPERPQTSYRRIYWENVHSATTPWRGYASTRTSLDKKLRCRHYWRSFSPVECASGPSAGFFLPRQMAFLGGSLRWGAGLRIRPAPACRFDGCEQRDAERRRLGG